MNRETWVADGRGHFQIDHFVPQCDDMDLLAVYENLFYTCTACNKNKLGHKLPLNPCVDAMGRHIKTERDGSLTSLTKKGKAFITALRLNRESRINYRRGILNRIDAAIPNDIPSIRDILSYPEDLPNLGRLKPRLGNSKPDGVKSSFWARKKEGILPVTYC